MVPLLLAITWCGRICNDPLELSASVHDVKIAVFGAVHTHPRHRPVAIRIHGIGAIRMELQICSSTSTIKSS